MKQRLCLHGLEVKHQAQLLGLLKKLLPGAAVKFKVKEKYFNDNDMYKCRAAKFTSVQGCQVSCLWGVLLVSDRIMPVADIIIKFDGQNKAAVETVDSLLQRLLSSRFKFVLEEPDLSQRIDQLRGCYELEQLENYDKNSAMTAVYCHLPWQLYGINKLWAEILERGAERTLWRQLRVKLRRLRSSLTLCKPLLPQEQAAQWQGALKARTNILSQVREYDVILLACARLKLRQQEEQTLPLLTAALTKLREQAAVQSLKGLKLNRLTLELSRLLLWLYSVPTEAGEKTELLDFFRERFGDWYEKLAALPEKYPDLHDMEQLHRIRIKLKRFRYALQGVPELAASPQLLRSLKYLQDMLGRLHDDYINSLLLDDLLAVQPELRYEVALFTGWEQGKADAALEALPAQWDNFIELLGQWKDDNL